MTDTGQADPRLAAALSHAAGPADPTAELLAALASARVFAAMTATSTAEHVAAATGLRAESSAQMAVLLLEDAGGSRALPVFSDLGRLARWSPQARPIPLSGAQACAAALDAQASAVVLDLPDLGVVVSGPDLTTMARGWVPVTGTALASRRAVTELTEPAVPAPEGLTVALRAALKGERLRAARLLDGPEGWVLGVAARSVLDPAGLTALAARVATRLGPALPPQGLDLAQVPVAGPGQDVLSRLRRRR